MLAHGFFYVPPDRRAEGLVMMRGARENISLPSLNVAPFCRGPLLDRAGERAKARELAQRLNLTPLNLERAVDHFSGGNQQKVMLAKALSREVKLFAFDEPTVGVDVGTRVAIYQFIRDLCEAGAAILLISSDLPEILHLTNRAYIMHRGILRAELVRQRHHRRSNLEQLLRTGGCVTGAVADKDRAPAGIGLRLQHIFVRLGVLPFLLAIAIVVFSLASDRFLTLNNG